MQIRVRIIRHIIVDDDVDPLNVDPTGKQIRGHHDTALELFEGRIGLDSVLLRHPRMNASGGELALAQEVGEGRGPGHRLHKDDHLVELEGIQKVVQLSVLSGIRSLDIVLLQSVEGELGVRVHVDLNWVLHELLGRLTDVLRHGCGIHHHLLILRCLQVDLLHITTHVQLVQHPITFIQNEVLEFLQFQGALVCQRKDTTRRAHNNVGKLVTLRVEGLLVFGNKGTAIEDCAVGMRKVLRETGELVVDLERQLACVAEDQTVHELLVRLFQLLKSRQHKDRSLAHPGFGLAEQVLSQNRLRDALVLHLRRMLKPAVLNGTIELGLQQEVTESGDVDP
mmetsp:Transcript_84567/g.141017  ORF Transcript_84567/g.141017 Transcript_84567/m.141017 type:complete len:338 (+) Transcript_84567:450-1463(+)